MTDQTENQNPEDDDEVDAAPETDAEYAEIYGTAEETEESDDDDDDADDEDKPVGESVPSAPVEAPESATRGSGERIAKVMARAGVASRREAERMIIEGRVTVNGEKISSPALDILPSDKVKIDGKPMEAPQETRLWMYYKPVGLVTSEADEKGRQTVFDALPRDLPRVMSVGRLDLNSEGLLLLTNDGELKRRLELPSTGWLRRYRVRVNGQPTDLTFGPLRRGATIDGEEFQPMEVKIDSQKGANAWLTVGIREGRNREIRRAMAHVGLVVNRLIRISYGPFRLTGMEENEVKEVKRRILRDQLGSLLAGETTDDAPPSRRPAGGRGDRDDRRGGGPRRDFASGGDRKPRSRDDGADFKPRAPRDGDFARKPRGDRDEGFRDRKPREGYGDRKPREAYGDRKPREGFGDRKPREGYGDRKPRSRDEGYIDRPRAARDDAYADRKPRFPRRDEESGDRGRPPRGDYADRKPRFARRDEEGQDRPRPPRGDFGSDRKPRGPRRDGDDFAGRTSAPRRDGDAGADRKPRWNRDDRDARPARDDAGRSDRRPSRYGAEGDGKGRGERPARFVRGDSDDRAPRRKDGAGPKQGASRGFGAKGDDARGERPRSFGPKGGSRDGGAKPRSGGPESKGPRSGGSRFGKAGPGRAGGGGRPGGGRPAGPRKPGGDR